MNKNFEFKNTVSNAIMLAFPDIIYHWEREPLQSNSEVLKILSNIRLAVAYVKTHPLILKSIRIMEENRLPENKEITVANKNLISKLIVDDIECSYPNLKELWEIKMDNVSTGFDDNLSEIVTILKYAHRHPRFFQSLNDGTLDMEG